MQKILARSNALLSSSNLNTGIWYPIDYYNTSKKLGQMTPLIQRGATFHGYAPEDFFESMPHSSSPTGQRLYTFLLKKGKSPSKAIQSLYEGLSLLDCGTVCYLASYLALRDLLGEEKFDQLFSYDSPLRLTLTADKTPTLSQLFPKYFIQSEAEIQEGDICYFSNCKEYVCKHPAGEARGYTVLCCSTEPRKYLAFGLSPEGQTRDEVEYSLFGSFNEDPVDEGFYPPAIWNYIYRTTLLCDEKKNRELLSRFQEKRLTWDEYRSAPSRFDPKKIPSDGKMGLWVHRSNLNYNSLGLHS